MRIRPTQKLEPSEHEELLALYKNQSENIEFTKNRNLVIAASYSAICAFLISECLVDAYVLVLLAISLIPCFMVLQDNHEKIRNRRLVLERLEGNRSKNEPGYFSEHFRYCVDPLRQNGKTLTDKGKVDESSLSVFRFYLVIVLAVTFYSSYKMEWKLDSATHGLTVSVTRANHCIEKTKE